MTLLTVEDLTVQYRIEGGTLTAVDQVSFQLDRGTILGVLGESGCGKSTLVESIVRILPENADIPAGMINFDGKNLLSLTEAEVRKIRWNEIAFIPQNAMASLDPVLTLREQMIDVIQNHRDVDRSECNEMAEEVLETVGIDASRLDAYPHQLSGGMKQRVILAISLLLKPKLIIADEPTTGVDVIMRDRILRDIEHLRDAFDISFIIISHDIADLVETCDQLAVAYAGKIVEHGPTQDIFETPTHPYTIALKNALPSMQTDPENLVSMSMDPPNLRDPPDECRFAGRCPFVIDECLTTHPSLKSHKKVDVACYRADEAASFREESGSLEWKETA